MQEAAPGVGSRQRPDVWSHRAYQQIDRHGQGYDGGDGFGSVRFIEGELDYRGVARDGRPGVEFSWEGHDEYDPASGRGWAVLNPDGSLDGHIYFHLGDDSAFQAVSFDEVPQ
jgi:hypothetical protein